MTGQKVNLGKSYIIFCADVSNRYRSAIKRRLQMSEGRYPIQYSGDWYEKVFFVSIQAVTREN